MSEAKNLNPEARPQIEAVDFKTAARDIVEIDSDLCDGCGLCLDGCAEGALALVDGKARLVGDVYCDGLGACLGQCPTGALKIVRRLSLAFDEAAAMERAKVVGGGGCPGHKAVLLDGSPSRGNKRPNPKEAAPGPDPGPSRGPSLSAWPIQLALVSPKADIFAGATIVVAADCVAFASPDFHRLFLGKGDALLVGCPKLDDAELYAAKLGAILKVNANLKRARLPIMSVPCCGGMWCLAQEAVRRSGRGDVVLEGWVFTNRGEIERESEILSQVER